MKYAIVDNGSVIAHGSASELWPDTSFTNGVPNQSFLEEVGAVEIGFITCDPATETITPCPPYILNGEVFDTVATAIAPPSVEEKAIRRRARYEVEADPFLHAALGYDTEAAVEEDLTIKGELEAKAAAARTSYLAIKATIRAEIG